MDKQCPEMITIKEASERSGIPYCRIKKWCETKQIVFMMSGKKTFVNWDKFVVFLNGNNTAKMQKKSARSVFNENICENGYKPQIDVATTKRIVDFCKKAKVQKSKQAFVVELINAQLDYLEDHFYESLTKEQLIQLLKEKETKNETNQRI